MKALFKSHFPFVEGIPESELTPEQLIIKQTYDKLYPSGRISMSFSHKNETRANTKTKAETDRLRKVYGNDEPAKGDRKE